MSSRSKTSHVAPTPVSLPEIKLTQSYLERLRSFVQPQPVLRQNGYITDQLSADEIKRKKRCALCGKYIHPGSNSRHKDENTRGVNKKENEATHNSPVQSERAKASESDQSVMKKFESKQPTLKCHYHNGILQGQMWSCCRQYRYSKGCTKTENHLPRFYKEGELQAMWRYYTTPPVSKGITPRVAVALDCEMGTNKYGETELLRISVIDYFTTEVLLNSLVYPEEQMGDYQTRYSGVSSNQMETARRKRQCLDGKKAAREAVWKFVGPETILIGHSANNDMNALRWIHSSTIDTLLIDLIINEKRKMVEALEESEKAKTVDKPDSVTQIQSNKQSVDQLQRGMVAPPLTVSEKVVRKPRGPGSLSLKSLTKSRLGRDIQQGRAGHDSLEDAIATRDLTHWNVIMRGFEDMTIS